MMDDLIRAMGRGTGIAQQEARRALEAMGPPAVGPLIQALLHHRDPVIRSRAAEALGHIGDARAVGPLIQAMADEATSVQWRAIEALAEIGEPALPQLEVAAASGNLDISWGAERAMTDIMARKWMAESQDYFSRVGSIRDGRRKVCGCGCGRADGTDDA